MIEFKGFGNLLYFIKLIRLSRGMELLNVHKLMCHIKNFYKEYTLKLLRDDPLRGMNRAVDNNKMTQIMVFSFILRLIRIIINIFSFAYFIGMGWLCLCKGSYTLLSDENSLLYDPDDYFISAYDMLDMDIYI